MVNSKYEVLLKAIELKSITKAAESIGYTQSGVSHIINSIEQEIGFPIVARSKSGITWNPIGESLAPYIQAISDSERRFRQRIEDISSLASGRVNIGAFISASAFLLPRFIAEFSKTAPDIDVVVRVGDYQEVEKWLAEGEVDMAFTLSPTERPFKTTVILKDEIRAILPKDHPLLYYNYVPVEKIMEYPYIMYGYCNYRDFYNLDSYKKLIENAKYQVKDDATTISMVESGLGIALLSKMISSQYHFNVEYRSLKPKLYRNIVLATPLDMPLSPPAQKFYDSFMDYRITTAVPE